MDPMIRGAGPRRTGLALPAMLALGLMTWARCAAEMPAAQFSPDGYNVLTNWPSAPRGNIEVAIIGAETGATRRLGAAAVPGGAAWSPDGRWIAFQAMEGGQKVTRVYDARAGSARTISRTFGPPYAWREDSRRLAGVAVDDERGLQIVFYNASERGESLRVSVDASAVSSMVWLPETDDVAFIGLRDGKKDVYAVEGGQVRKISTSGDVLALTLVSARNELVWARSSKNTRYILLSLYAFDLRSRSVRRLPFPDRVAQINPTPSRSPIRVDDIVIAGTGTYLALVVSDPPVTNPKTKRQTQVQRLFTIKTDGTGGRLVRTLALDRGGVHGQEMHPFWSWDGMRLGVLHREAGRVTLLQYGADGSGGRVIARSGSGG